MNPSLWIKLSEQFSIGEDRDKDRDEDRDEDRDLDQKLKETFLTVKSNTIEISAGTSLGLTRTIVP